MEFMCHVTESYSPLWFFFLSLAGHIIVLYNFFVCLKCFLNFFLYKSQWEELRKVPSLFQLLTDFGMACDLPAWILHNHSLTLHSRIYQEVFTARMGLAANLTVSWNTCVSGGGYCASVSMKKAWKQNPFKLRITSRRGLVTSLRGSVWWSWEAMQHSGY